MTYHDHDSNLWILTDVAWCRFAPHVGLAPALGLWRTCRGVSAAPAGRARPRGSQEAPEKLPSPEMAKECPSTRSSHDINNIKIQTFSHDMQFWPICETSPTHSFFVSGWQVGSCLIAVWAVPENERTHITARVVQWCSMMFNDVQWSPFLLVKSH